MRRLLGFCVLACLVAVGLLAPQATRTRGFVTEVNAAACAYDDVGRWRQFAYNDRIQGPAPDSGDLIVERDENCRITVTVRIGGYDHVSEDGSTSNYFRLIRTGDNCTADFQAHVLRRGDDLRLEVDGVRGSCPIDRRWHDWRDYHRVGSAPTSRSSGSSSSSADHGMRVTFKNCGYRISGLNVRCSGHAELLEVGDTTPNACAQKLVKACRAAGYSAEQSGDTAIVHGMGIRVESEGGLITVNEF